MSRYIILPEVTYTVTTMSGENRELSVSDFQEQIKDENFIKDMQCFYRYLWKKQINGKMKFYHQQSPCLIVRDIVYDNDFNKHHLYAMHQILSENPYYRQDCCMISYSDQAEPIRPDWMLFDRNMQLLLPQNRDHDPAHYRFSNATELRRGMGNLPRLMN